MVLNHREKEVFDKLEEMTKELTEGQYNYEIVSGGLSNNAFDILIEHIENQIDFVNEHQDSKKRFEIMKGFYNKLESDNLYNSYLQEKKEKGFFDAKKVSQAPKSYYETAKKFRNSPDKEHELDSLCKLYAYSYERACRLYFKSFAKTIAKKEINSCGDCIDIIIDYYPDIEFVLRPFIPHIRNSIDHVDYYYIPKDDIIVFEDRKKPPIKISLKKLRDICALQTYSDVCISTAYYAINLQLYKTAQHYWKKTEEYCKILQIDFNEIVLAWALKGKNILSLHNALEKMIKE